MEFTLQEPTLTKDGHQQENEASTDGISSLSFSPVDQNLLLTGNWNKNVRLYDVSTNELKWEIQHKAAVLDVCFQDYHNACSGSLDKTVKTINLATSQNETIGKHDDAVKSVLYSSSISAIISGSWDKTIKLWDVRSENEKCQGSFTQPQKIFSMDITGNTLVVGMSGRVVHIYDVRNMKEAVQKRESSLKFMTRVIKCMPSGEGYAMGSIEGRIAVEFFDSSSESQTRKYAFKCHRQQIDDTDMVYPVNALAFHPVHGTFASGGGDGVVNCWDGLNKKRIKQIGRYPTSISSMAFNCYGNYLAIAASYTFEEGEKEHPKDSIIIRKVTDTDVKPKSLK